ncbi:DUF2009 protein [Schizosaccharomyces japonicus yFS275]|uniref:DUF2009 protein n=1 Tax=Schizosaccharomyces japonicus (strain yFS275 / FY16936) TaxID=402676 RepID=B6K0V7_SCHJY|nr:DUF2009 protein [Schizosaccharomyces japonicus yFS275]EEB07578.1 DUF2009 protein [Schizosaccharomyces japonicus yFS275]
MSVNDNEQAIEQLRDLYLSSIVAEPFSSLEELNGNYLSNSKITIAQKAKVVPLRLQYDERKLLRLLEASLNVSDYTDVVDILTFSTPAKRTATQLKGISSILSGIMIAYDYQVGQELLKHRNYEQYADFFQSIFEIGRRYKVLNPDKMKVTYGKMMYVVQDSMLPEVKDVLSFSLFKPILTVHEFLRLHEALGLLDDPLVKLATAEIIPDNKSRKVLQKEIREKEQAVEKLARKYTNTTTSKDQIRWCLYSLADSNAYLRANRDPIHKLLSIIEQYFSPTEIEDDFNLSISATNGSRLVHDHYKQYHYVVQSLQLWSLIMGEIFSLWALSDLELCNPETTYTLIDNGQGIHRMQPCPKIREAMERILRRAQTASDSWIGSTTIHLGDTAVPNALIFIDKYMQVPRILSPLVLVLKELDELKDPGVLQYIENAFITKRDLEKTILADFMRYAFDGSGADNWFDAGSCIDGRLTSAWNWANTIHTREYYRILLMSGFLSFNGE